MKERDAASLRQRAEKCRKLCKNVADSEEAQRLWLLANDLDRTADVIDSNVRVPPGRLSEGHSRDN